MFVSGRSLGNFGDGHDRNLDDTQVSFLIALTGLLNVFDCIFPVTDDYAVHLIDCLKRHTYKKPH